MIFSLKKYDLGISIYKAYTREGTYIATVRHNDDDIAINKLTAQYDNQICIIKKNNKVVYKNYGKVNKKTH